MSLKSQPLCTSIEEISRGENRKAGNNFPLFCPRAQCAGRRWEEGGISKQPHGRLGAAACQETPQSHAARRAMSTRSPRAWPGSQHPQLISHFNEIPWRLRQEFIPPLSPGAVHKGWTLSSSVPSSLRDTRDWFVPAVGTEQLLPVGILCPEMSLLQ